MSSRYRGKRKKNKPTERSTRIPVLAQAPCPEHSDNREGDSVKKTNQDPLTLVKDWRVDIAVFISFLALVAYFTQACYMRKAMRVDQRAWISIPFPNSFPLDGTYIPVLTQIINSGKTPAKGLLVDVIATVFNKGDKPTVGDFSIGHPHE